MVNTTLDRELDRSMAKESNQEPSQDGATQETHQRATRGVLFTFLVFTFCFFIFYLMFLLSSH